MTWKALRGKRPYAINRLARSEHVELIERAGFEILFELNHERDDGDPVSEFSAKFSGMGERDSRTEMSFLATRKPN